MVDVCVVHREANGVSDHYDADCQGLDVVKTRTYRIHYASTLRTTKSPGGPSDTGFFQIARSYTRPVLFLQTSFLESKAAIPLGHPQASRNMLR